MPAKVGFVAIDTVDPAAVAPLWPTFLEVQVGTDSGEGEILLLTPNEKSPIIGFQRVPEVISGRKWGHLDLAVDDLDAATAEVGQLGGQWSEPGLAQELEGFRWRRMSTSRATRLTSTYSLPNRR